MAEYKLITTEGRAKRGEFKTVHGTIQTPVFMNVGTIAAIVVLVIYLYLIFRPDPNKKKVAVEQTA